MTATFDEEMRAALAAGVPNLDNVGDGTADGPDVCTCPALPGEHTEDQCAPEVGARRCPTCRGAGGWQQHDGAIEERPRGCMTAEPVCARCGTDEGLIVNDLCHDCDWLEDHPHHTRRIA